MPGTYVPTRASHGRIRSTPSTRYTCQKGARHLIISARTKPSTHKIHLSFILCSLIFPLFLQTMEIVVTLPNDFTTTQESSKHRNVVANWNGGSNDELYPPSVEETTSSWDSTSRTSEDDDDEVYSQSSHSKDSRTLGSEEDCPTTKSSSDCLMNVQTCSSSSSSLINKKVSFGTLQVRKYPFILGDHPDVNGGPPVR
jgi:hypothetical protein